MFGHPRRRSVVSAVAAPFRGRLPGSAGRISVINAFHGWIDLGAAIGVGQSVMRYNRGRGTAARGRDDDRRGGGGRGRRRRRR